MNLLYVENKHDDILLYTIPLKILQKLKEKLSECLFSNNNENDFISYIKTQDECSLFISKNLLHSYFSESEKELINYLKEQKKYISFKFYEKNTGISQVGIVNKISEVFSEINIPIIYVNSYENNYILMESYYKEHAINTLLQYDDFKFIEL